MRFTCLYLCFLFLFTLSPWALSHNHESINEGHTCSLFTFIQSCPTPFSIYTIMSNSKPRINPKSNCIRVHPERPIQGPCIHCGQNDVSARYFHLFQQKIQNPAYYSFITENYKISDTCCICRKCEAQFKKIFAKSSQPVENQGPSCPKKLCKNTESSENQEQNLCCLKKFSLCQNEAKHFTFVDPLLFQKTFKHGISEDSEEIQIAMCHVHYNKLNNVINQKELHQCVIWEKSSHTKRFVTIPSSSHDLFLKYLKNEMNMEFNITENLKCCTYCYNCFNSYCRSEAGENAQFQTTKYLTECFEKYLSLNELDKEINIDNVDSYSLQQVVNFVFQNFLADKPVLVPFMYDKYKGFLNGNIECFNLMIPENSYVRLCHSSKWILRILKMCFGKCMLQYIPNNKKTGSMIYRNGSDILGGIHSILVEFNSNIKAKASENEKLRVENEKLMSEKNRKMPNHEILNEATKILRVLVKHYVSGKISSNNLPDIHSFDPDAVISEIPPVLWNFLFRISATDTEEKNWVKSIDSWEKPYTETPFNILRTFPRIFLASCVFNTQNSQCMEPMHLLLTDLAHKFSNSSSTFLSINAKIGLGVSKESLQRFITDKCIALEKTNRYITKAKFTIASFDNLDKNQSYSVVGAGRDKSGFHGTTIQTVTPRPTLKLSEPLQISDTQMEQAAAKSLTVQINSNFRSRSLPLEFVDKVNNPGNNIGPPIPLTENRFHFFNLSNFRCTEKEKDSLGIFTKNIQRYGFVKYLLQEEKIAIPGVKSFFT